MPSYNDIIGDTMKPLRCDDCEKYFDHDDIEIELHEIQHLFDRIKPGGTVPYGECPECGSLVYPVDQVYAWMVMRKDLSGALWSDGRPLVFKHYDAARTTAKAFDGVVKSAEECQKILNEW